MIEMIFLFLVFVEIFIIISGGFGYELINFVYLIYNQVLLQFDVGMVLVGGLIVVLIVNIVVIVLVWMIGKNFIECS